MLLYLKQLNKDHTAKINYIHKGEKMMKKTVTFLLPSLVLFILAACGNDEDTGADADPLRIGVTAGPHEDIVNKVRDIAAEDGFEIEVVVFDDYVMPNTALADGDLDANLMQTRPYLESIVAESGYDLEIVEPMVTFPMAVFSENYTSIEEIQEGDTIALPNSATQEGRALLIFESAGLITLPEGLGIEATTSSIEENPLNLNFITSEAAQLPAQLTDVDAAAINTNFAFEAGLVPSEDAIFSEDPDDLTWVNNLVSRSEDTDDERFQQFIDYYKTDEIKEFIEEEFKGSVVPSW